MYKVKIDSFEGPFDLLVYLIENAKMDIYDIRVSEITEQYIDYLKEMDDLNVEVGSEFIVLASVLIKLKSRMLLPRLSEDGEAVVDDDPRRELAEKLAEYMRTKKIAAMLEERWEYSENIFEKPAEDMSKYLESPDELLRTDMDQFVEAFSLFLQKKRRVEDVRKRYQRVRRQRESIEVRIEKMTEIVQEKLKPGESIDFSELLPDDPDRYDLALSFTSLLEMIKMQEVDAEQHENYGRIRVVRKETDS